jgi:hypothetical protein
VWMSLSCETRPLLWMVSTLCVCMCLCEWFGRMFMLLCSCVVCLRVFVCVYVSVYWNHVYECMLEHTRTQNRHGYIYIYIYMMCSFACIHTYVHVCMPMTLQAKHVSIHGHTHAAIVI